MAKAIKLGIRQLVEFSCRSGDLGYEAEPAVSAIEGIRTHQKIQQRYRQQASAEYPLRHIINIDEYEVELGGRVDLLFANETPPRVEEIKTVYRFTKDTLTGYDQPHWAQARCYAACYAIDQQLDEIAVSLNFVKLFGVEEHREVKTYHQAELVAWLEQVLRRYLDWHRLISRERENTVASARDLAFPFETFRRQQHGFAARVYRGIQQGKRLLIEAPTGSGKTISTLFPSIKAIGEGLADQIIYLSAKTSGQNQAIKAIDAMIDKGLQISYLVIQAKAKCCACVHDQREITDQGKCRRTLGFFDRLPAAREKLMQIRRLSSGSIRTVADEYRLCPFELSLQILPWVDIVICDLNYIFDPLVQLSYFKTDSKRKVLLIDEMHNLVDRARGMYSACINRKQIKHCARAANSTAVSRAVNSVATALDKCGRSLTDDETIGKQVPVLLTRAASRFSEKLGIDLFNNKQVASETLEFAKTIFRFKCINNLYSEHHRTISIKPVTQREVKLICLNAFEYLRKIYPLFSSVCGFSATLSPANYFLQALGFDQDARAIRLDSSFPPQHLQVSICSYVDTRYRQRDQYISQICATINAAYAARPGNYLVFFSSYHFMHKVHDHFDRHYAGIDTMKQIRAADDAQRSDFLSHYFERDNTLGFAIMGGIFAEGIDYAGSSLIGAIIVGVGMPQANTEQQLIQQDFDSMQMDGFDFAYRFPGLTRVQQSAGRVIRSETDRGVVVLIDNRFRQAAYRRHLPPHWQAEECRDTDALRQSLKQFWDSQPA
ncbi:MAG: ATP-dependent DNA helicase [Gammaproteobacteria bacterium]|nr:ATP-dependent DNA helicase [Gammaproteobacteria bacterium]